LWQVTNAIAAIGVNVRAFRVGAIGTGFAQTGVLVSIPEVQARMNAHKLLLTRRLELPLKIFTGIPKDRYAKVGVHFHVIADGLALIGLLKRILQQIVRLARSNPMRDCGFLQFVRLHFGQILGRTGRRGCHSCWQLSYRHFSVGNFMPLQYTYTYKLSRGKFSDG
jgi:hypothetical protein